MLQYEPELFPGLIYRMKVPKVVLLIFVSGKVVLTGNTASLRTTHHLPAPMGGLMACMLLCCACACFVPQMLSIAGYYLLQARRSERRSFRHLKKYTRCLGNSGRVTPLRPPSQLFRSLPHPPTPIPRGTPPGTTTYTLTKEGPCHLIRTQAVIRVSHGFDDCITFHLLYNNNARDMLPAGFASSGGAARAIPRGGPFESRSPSSAVDVGNISGEDALAALVQLL